MSACSSASPSGPRRCVLVLGLDGCRPDCITRDVAPVMFSLVTEEKHADDHRTAFSLQSQVGDICWSGPGWTSACTGVWRDKSGVSGNTFPTAQFDSYPNIFARLKAADPSIVTASCVNWKPLNENILLPSDHAFTHEEDDAAIVDSACCLLKEQERLDILFVHLDDIDHAGHAFDYGPSIPEYIDAVSKTDARLTVLMQALRDRPWYAEEDWLTVITTDHGGIDYTHEDGRPENRTNFLILKGADIAPGEIFPSPVIVDVAPTILAHMGVKLKSSWHLDGRPVGLKLTGRGHFMDLNASQDPTNRYPIPAAELEEEAPSVVEEASELPAPPVTTAAASF